MVRPRQPRDCVVKQGVLHRNVAALVDAVPTPHDEKFTGQTYTEEQVATLARHITDDRLEHAWLLALLGLHRGEICGLRWSAVDFDAGYLSVQDNRVAAPGGAVDGDVKTIGSVRRLPMPEPLVHALRAAKRRKIERLKAGPNCGYVVTNLRTGEPFHPQTLSDKWNAITADAGLPHIRLHDARPTALTLMHLSGVPIAVVAEWAGHRDAAFTQRRYAHSQASHLAVAGAVLGSFVSKRVSDAEPG